MDRPILYSWTASRSGASITVEHSCGKITGVYSIEPLDGMIVALVPGKAPFQLHIPEGENPVAGAMKRMRKPQQVQS